MGRTKTMKEYEFQKHRISRIVLLEMEGEFTTAEFRELFGIKTEELRIDVRTPIGSDRRSGAWEFTSWSDRVARLLIHYCDKVNRRKWRVNLKKEKWGIFDKED